MEKEKFFKCPFCFERISVLLDLSEDGSQSYTEDCEVCCHPILLSYDVRSNELSGFSYTKAYG